MESQEAPLLRCMNAGHAFQIWEAAGRHRHPHLALALVTVVIFLYSNMTMHGLRGRVWGVDNREAPLRLCMNAGRASQNWEFKSLDATASPHLALSALIAAGCDVRAHPFCRARACRPFCRATSRLFRRRSWKCLVRSPFSNMG